MHNFEGLLDDTFFSALDEKIAASSKSDEASAYLDGKLPPSILEFAESSEYCGLSGQLYPEVRQILVDIENPKVREADLILGKGSGKSQLAKIVTLYGICVLSHMRNPQAFYGLTDDTTIYCGVVSVSSKQAKDNIFAGVKSLVANSPYFAGKFELFTEEIKFKQKNLGYFCGSSNASAFLGYATYRAVIDEVNFCFDSNNRSVAQMLYTALRGSLKTRFPDSFKIVLISSDSGPNSFLRKKYKFVTRKLGLSSEPEVAEE